VPAHDVCECTAAYDDGLLFCIGFGSNHRRADDDYLVLTGELSHAYRRRLFVGQHDNCYQSCARVEREDERDKKHKLEVAER